MSGNPIGKEGVSHLLAAAEGTKLEELNLDDTAVPEFHKVVKKIFNHV